MGAHVYLNRHRGELVDATPSRTFWRYYFAGQALAGVCANPDAIGGSGRHAVAIAAGIADDLIARLESSPAAPSGPLDTDGEEEGRG